MSSYGASFPERNPSSVSLQPFPAQPDGQTNRFETTENTPFMAFGVQESREPENPPQVQVAPRSQETRMQIILASGVSTVFAVALFAGAFFTKGLVATAFVATGFGFFACVPVLAFTSYEKGELFKDITNLFSPFAYWGLTQLDLNTPSPRWSSRLITGGIYTLMGLQLAAQLHNTINWRYEHSFLMGSGTTQEREKHYTLAAPCSLKTLALASYAIKTLLAVSLLAVGYFASPSIAELGQVFGYFLLSNVICDGVHRCLDYASIKYDNPEAHQGSLSYSVIAIRVARKIELFIATLFTGVIGFSRTSTYVVAGMAVAFKRGITWERYWKTPVSELKELEFHQEVPSRVKMKALINRICGVVWFGFFLWRIIVGDSIERTSISVFTAALLARYLVGRFGDTYRICDENHPWKNLAFYFLNYSVFEPVIFMLIIGWMEVGDTAQQNYGGYKQTLANLAYFDGGTSFGALGAQIETARNTAFAANLTPLFSLFPYSLSQLIAESLEVDGTSIG